MNVLQKIGAFIGQAYKSLFDIIDAHKEDKNNPHDVDKNDVGLGRVDNTSDAEKPLSEAQQEAIGSLNGAITSHIGDETIHFEMSDVDSSVDSKIENHDSSNVAHQDIRNEMQNIKEGAVPVKKSEYAEKLGTEVDHYTKTTLDAKINKHIKNVVYNPVNAIFTFTFEDGTTTVIDTPVEGTVKDGWFDSATNELVLVLVSEQEIRIPAAGLVKVYSGKETTTTQTSVSSGGEISVDLKQGCIDTVHLSESLLAAINDHLTKTGDTKDNVVSFEEAAEGANIVSGEKLSVIFGKIKKWFSKNNDKLDNLASNPNFTYATKDELTALEDNPDVIIIPVDLRDLDYESTVKSYISNNFSFDDNVLFHKPVYLKFLWKEDYATEGAQTFVMLVKGEVDLSKTNVLLFNCPYAFLDINYPDDPIAYCVKIERRVSAYFTSFNEYVKPDDIMVFRMISLPPGGNPDMYPDSTNTLLSNPMYGDLSKAVTAIKEGRKVLFCLISPSCSAILSLDVKSGIIDRRKTIVEISGCVPVINQVGKLTEYCFRVISDEFTYTDSNSLAGVYGKCYMSTVSDYGRVFVLECDNDYVISNADILSDYVAAEKTGKNPLLALRKSGFQILNPSSVIFTNSSVVVIFDMHSTPVKNQESDIENNKMSYTMLIIGAAKQGESWFCHVQQHVVKFDVWDYMKASNIHIVSEYPTDLSEFPDGSIFIKE